MVENSMINDHGSYVIDQILSRVQHAIGRIDTSCEMVGPQMDARLTVIHCSFGRTVTLVQIVPHETTQHYSSLEEFINDYSVRIIDAINNEEAYDDQRIAVDHLREDSEMQFISTPYRNSSFMDRIHHAVEMERSHHVENVNDDIYYPPLGGWNSPEKVITFDEAEIGRAHV